MNNYNFKLTLSGVDENTPGLEDSLYKAKCDDALLCFQNGTAYLDFTREAGSLKTAILSAIKAVEKRTEGKVLSVSPDTLVSEAEIANRINKSRQAVSLWAKRERQKQNPFPSPVYGIDSKRPLWRWYDVAQWLYAQKLIEKSELQQATIIDAINAALAERDPVIQEIKSETMRKLF